MITNHGDNGTYQFSSTGLLIMFNIFQFVVSILLKLKIIKKSFLYGCFAKLIYGDNSSSYSNQTCNFLVKSK